MTDVARGLAEVRARIAAAEIAAGRRPGSVSLLAVSKRHPPEAIRAAYAAGQRDFGENYPQELLAKLDALRDLPDLRLHLIGHLQTNKAKAIARAGVPVQTVDSTRLARVLAAAAAQPLAVMLQVNVAGEAQKSGADPDDLPELLAACRSEPLLKVRGLMTVPPAGDVEATRRAFVALRNLARAHDLSELSMGMSEDLEIAIAEGSTCVRVGTAIFGAREPTLP